MIFFLERHRKFAKYNVQFLYKNMTTKKKQAIQFWDMLTKTSFITEDEILKTMNIDEEQFIELMRLVREQCTKLELPNLSFRVESKNHDSLMRSAIAQEIFWINDCDWSEVKNPFLEK